MGLSVKVPITLKEVVKAQSNNNVVVSQLLNANLLMVCYTNLRPKTKKWEQLSSMLTQQQDPSKKASLPQAIRYFDFTEYLDSDVLKNDDYKILSKWKRGEEKIDIKIWH